MIWQVLYHVWCVVPGLPERPHNRAARVHLQAGRCQRPLGVWRMVADNAQHLVVDNNIYEELPC